MTPESRNSSLLGNGSVNVFPRKRTTEDRCFLWFAPPRCYVTCDKHISATVNQHTIIEEVVFSVGAAPRLYNEDLKQLELELS
jgi:hypothetical protein